MATPDRARKLLVRSALATSATAAVFIGAGNLATLDAHVLDSALQPASEFAAPSTSAGAALPVIQHVAPSLTIVRASGSAGSTSASTRIQPPAAVQMAAPVRIPRPVLQRSRASR